MMPPPNVTGSLHIGHALTFTLQDILIRFHRMQNRDVLWQPGTDHAGIATQMVVERQLAQQKVYRADLSRDDFVKKVWDWKEESGGTIMRQLRRLGASADWSRERFTLDDGLSRAVTKVFVDLYRKKLIYRNKRLVNWDPKLHTAISDLEVEQREAIGRMWYFRYPVDGIEDEYLVVGTTRPETMLGDTGVAVNPKDSRYSHLVGKFCILPLSNRKIPIVADDYADPEKGSGAVKITPAHDFNDFEVGVRHSLDRINIFDENAAINTNAPQKYIGMDRFEARDVIIQDLRDLGLFEKIEENLMVVPYGDRSGVVIEPWLTDQWFVDAKTLAVSAIRAVEDGKTKIIPKQWENTYFEWMRNIQPWCISRQLWWGHRIPAWFGPDGKIFVEENEADALKAAKHYYGQKVELVRDPDVLDTWFSSALWPFSTLGWPDETEETSRYYPTNVLVTGFDIIFFWVARMMMMGIYFMNDVPFREVYIHALVRDEKGQKMSKSKGNVLDPLDLCNAYGTDAVRFTLSAMAAQGRDIKLSEQRIAGYRNFITKIWNAARFCEINSCKSSNSFDPALVKINLNRWIVTKVSEAGSLVGSAINNYRFNDAANIFYKFTWNTYCDWFLEFSKPILQGTDKEALSETRNVAAWVLDQILIIGHPIIPFVTEELWRSTSSQREGPLITQSWPDYANLIHLDSKNELDWVIELISAIRSIRSEIKVPPKAEISVCGHFTIEDNEKIGRLERNKKLIMRLARLSSLEVVTSQSLKNKTSAHTGNVSILVEGVTYTLELEGILDLTSEKERLLKEIDKIESEILRIDKKLNNKNFLEKADKNVVLESREKKDAMLTSKEKIKRLIDAMEAV